MNINKFYDHAYNWMITSGPRFLLGIVILIVGLWLIRIFARWSRARLQSKKVNPTLQPFLMSLITVAMRVLLVIAVMQTMGIQMTLFTALIGAFGVAAGLALSGTLQNFASGVLILLLKPFVVGDNILTQGMEGTVTSIQIFYTIVKTYDNRSVIVPNGKLSNDVIINISREGSRRLDILYKFSNAIDIKQIKLIINKSIDKSKKCLATPERRIGVAQLDPDSFTIGINVWVKSNGFEDTRQEVLETLLQDIKDSGVKIAGM